MLILKCTGGYCVLDRRTSGVKDSLDLPKQKVWTKQEFAARIIQTKYRQHLAKMQLKKYKERKKKLEDDMKRLEKAVGVLQLKDNVEYIGKE